VNRKHGLSNTPVYYVWCNMLKRCTNPNDPAYRNYGGRGIKVCARWTVFSNFFQDMGFPPRTTIERRNNDGDYTPRNCYWATRTAQALNRRPYKLTREQVAEIRQLAARGLRQNSIASQFGVNPSHISRIVRLEAFPPKEHIRAT